MNTDFRKTFEGKAALVTGGLGFIGSRLARRLVDLGAEVTIVDIQDPQTGANHFNIAEIEERVRLVIADVNDGERVWPQLRDRDFLFGLAGQSSHLGSMRDPLKDAGANAVAPLAVLDWCRKYNLGIRIVFAGTRQVYGRPLYLPVDEAHPCQPTDYNGVNKLAGDLYHLVCHRVYGLWTSVLRLTNVFGPHMRVRDAHQTFIGWWTRQLLDGRKLEVFGDGKRIRDLNYVDDVVEALLLCAVLPAAKGKIYNLGSEPVSLLDLARLMIEVNGGGAWELMPLPEERRSIDIGDYYGSFAKIHNELGWQPEISLRDGIARTLAFYRQHKQHYW